MAEARRDLPVPLAVELTRPGGTRSTEYAVNLSSGGTCLHLEEPLSPGQEVELSFDVPPDGPRVTTRAEVVWTAFDSDKATGSRFYETGLRFHDVEGPAHEALLAFASQPLDRRR